MASDLIGALLPALGIGPAWAVGTVVVLALLRPVGKTGWLAAGALIGGGLGAMAVAGVDDLDIGLGQALPWVLLAATLIATVAGRPLRWEPRTGPSSATALVVGGAVVHAGLAWHHGGGGLGAAARGWASGGIDASALPTEAAGPVLLPVAWALQLVPGMTGRGAVVVLELVAAAAVVLGAATLARRWGFTGTARATAAAVAWAPPVLLAHRSSPGALFAAAALVWSWWALGEVWSGRYRPDRVALLAGLLLGVAIGVAVWPVLLLPLWLGRLRGRRAGWFVVGLGVAVLAAVAALLPTHIGLADVWRVAVGDTLTASSLPAAAAVVLLVVAIAAGVTRRPLSPTRSTALSAAVLTLTLPWWPAAWEVTGPVVAMPFVLLAAVAPDRPEERWPPDAPLAEDHLADLDQQEVPT